MGQYNRESGTPGRNQFGITEDNLDAHRKQFREEQERLSLNRKYFEDGCQCIIKGTIEKQSDNLSDKAAVRYYEQNCKCSQNYNETKC